MVKKQFEILGGDFESETKEDNWFSKRKFTKEQKEEWAKFCIDLMRKKLRWSKKISEKEFAWFDLMYGFSEEDISVNETSDAID